MLAQKKAPRLLPFKQLARDALNLQNIYKPCAEPQNIFPPEYLSTFEENKCLYSIAFCIRGTVLAAGELQSSSVRRGQGCPMPDTAGSSQLPWPHHRARLGPAAEMEAPLGNVFEKR